MFTSHSTCALKVQCIIHGLSNPLYESVFGIWDIKSIKTNMSHSCAFEAITDVPFLIIIDLVPTSSF